MLVPDKSKPIFIEENVSITQGGTRPTRTYDLGLYDEFDTNGTNGVLVVTVILVFEFDDQGSLKWGGQEKTDFMNNVRKEVTATWSDQFTLSTKSSVPPAKTVSVLMDIKTRESSFTGSFGHSHWNIKVKKVSSLYPSRTVPGGGSCCSNGEARWDSLDLTPDPKGGGLYQQRAAIHEFGHILGYRDEYPMPPNPSADERELFTNAWANDKDSIMYWGEEVRPRHYLFFADWISLKWMAKDKNCKGHDWKVDGMYDLTNTRL